MPPEETPGLVPASDEAVHYVHHSPPPPSVIIGHRDHKRKRRKHYANDDALPQELTAAWSMIDAGRGDTEPATPMGGAHRSQRRAPAAERTTGASGSSSKDDKASSSVDLPLASSKAIRVKHSSSSFVIGGGSGKQHPAAGSGSHSYYANSHAAAAPSSSKRLTIRGPAAPPPPHLPAKARRPPSSSAAPSAAVPLEPEDGDEGCFRQGLDMFAGWDVATQQAAVNRFVRQQSPPKGDGFSFWLTPNEADEDLEYVHKKVEEARRTSKAASGSGKPQPALTRHKFLR